MTPQTDCFRNARLRSARLPFAALLAVLALLVMKAGEMRAGEVVAEETSAGLAVGQEKAEPLLSEEAVAFWRGPTIGSWRVPVLLKELGDDIKGLEKTPEHAVAAAAERYALSPKDAARLVDAEVCVASMLSTPRDWPDAEALRRRVERAVAPVPEQVDRWRLLIRFYGSLPYFPPEYRELSDQGIDVVVEAFEGGRLEDVWDDVESGHLHHQRTLNRLLAIDPASRLLLAKLAESTWDPPGRAALRLFLLRSVPEPDPLLANLTIRDLLAAGATARAVEVWQEKTVSLDLSGESRARESDRWVAESLTESIAAALWLEGRDDEAVELLASAPSVEPVEPPDPESGEPSFEARRAHQHRLGRSTRLRILRSGLMGSRLEASEAFESNSRPLEPYETFIESAGIRDTSFPQAAVGGPFWTRVAATWAAGIGHATLERHFLIEAWATSRFEPNERAYGGSLNWPLALEEGWIPAALYELRESIYQETWRTRELVHQRILALEGATTAGFFDRPKPSASPIEELERIVAPFSVRQLGEAAACAVDEGKDAAAEDEASETLDAGLPPTLPVLGDAVVALGRDGAAWWVLHHRSGGGHRAAWWTQAYWLSVSYDGGHSWVAPLHTGLLLRAPLEIVAYSVEVGAGELSLLARQRNWVVPGRHLHTERDAGDVPLVFELRVDLSDLRHDEDGDGWTDVFERGVFTDPESDDSDGDGLLDPQDLLPGHERRRPGAEAEALAFALRYLENAGSPNGHWNDDTGLPIQAFVGPPLPLTDMDSTLFDLQIVVLPEDLADDDRVGARFVPQIRLWLMNSDQTRAFLIWTGTSYGGVEFAQGPDGWRAVAGHYGAGCHMRQVEPPDPDETSESP